MTEQEQKEFAAGRAAFNAGISMNFAMSKAWRKGWDYEFAYSMRVWERTKALGIGDVRHG